MEGGGDIDRMLPDDMNSVLNNKPQRVVTFDAATEGSSNNITQPKIFQQQYRPQIQPQTSIYGQNNNGQISGQNNGQISGQANGQSTGANGGKKKNVFVKISNNISRKPKCYLVLIIALIIIILILIIYYRGLLFIGPYCPNNVKSKNYSKFKNGGDKFSKNKKGDDDKLISSLKL